MNGNDNGFGVEYVSFVSPKIKNNISDMQTTFENMIKSATPFHDKRNKLESKNIG